jgi:hypothetical protein
MHSDLEASEVPSGLEVGLPPSQGTSNHSARKPVPSYAAPSTVQDGMSQYPSEDGNKYLSEAGGISKPRRNPWGLSPFMFGLLVALITLIIVGAALGGGLGGSLASAQKKNTYVLSCNTPARLKLGIIPYFECSPNIATVLQSCPLHPQQPPRHLPYPQRLQLHLQPRQPSSLVTMLSPAQLLPLIPWRSTAQP